MAHDRPSPSLTPREKLLQQRVGEVLHCLWDPIGVAGAPEARDEYDGHAMRVLGLLLQGADEAAIADRLVGIEREWMELTTSGKRARRSAVALVRWRDLLLDPTG